MSDWQDPWNLIDLSMYGLLVVWVCSRSCSFAVPSNSRALIASSSQVLLRVPESLALGVAYDPQTEPSAIFLGLAAIFIWIRMLNVFGLDPIFGPLVRIIQGMVSNVASFMMLLVVFMAGFATCLKSVFMQVDPDHAGDFRLESYVDQTKSMVALLNMALGQFDLIELYDVDIMGWATALSQRVQPAKAFQAEQSCFQVHCGFNFSSDHLCHALQPPHCSHDRHLHRDSRRV
jgi:hypothetical protein